MVGNGVLLVMHDATRPAETAGVMAYVRRIRELKGIPQTAIAERLGMSQSQYSQMEKNRAVGYLPKPKQLAIIAEAIGEPESHLLRAAGYMQDDDAVADAARHELTTTLRSLKRAADTLISFQDLLGELLEARDRGDEAHEAQQQRITDHPAQRRRRVAG